MPWHRALRVRAAHHGRSTEAEIRAILDTAVRPPARVKLGSLLADIAREASGLTETESETFTQLRDKSIAEPLTFPPRRIQSPQAPKYCSQCGASIPAKVSRTSAISSS